MEENQFEGSSVITLGTFIIVKLEEARDASDACFSFHVFIISLISHLHKILVSDWLMNYESFLNTVQLINSTCVIK